MSARILLSVLCLISSQLLFAQQQPTERTNTKIETAKIITVDTIRNAPIITTPLILKTLPIDSLQRAKVDTSQQKVKTNGKTPSKPSKSGWGWLGVFLLLFLRRPKKLVKTSVLFWVLGSLFLLPEVGYSQELYRGIFIGVADSTDAEFVGLEVTLQDFVEDFSLVDTSLNEENTLIRILPPGQVNKIDSILANFLHPDGISLVRSFGIGADVTRDSLINVRPPNSPFIDVVEVNFPIIVNPIQLDTISGTDSIGFVVNRGSVSANNTDIDFLSGNSVQTETNLLNGNLSGNLSNNNVSVFDDIASFNFGDINPNFTFTDVLGVGRAAEALKGTANIVGNIIQRIFPTDNTSPNGDVNLNGNGSIFNQNFFGPTENNWNGTTSNWLQQQPSASSLIQGTSFTESSIPLGGASTSLGNPTNVNYTLDPQGNVDGWTYFDGNQANIGINSIGVPNRPSPVIVDNNNSSSFQPSSSTPNGTSIYDPITCFICNSALDPSGVDFSQITFSGFSFSPEQGMPVFISEADEFSGQGSTINPDNTTSNFKQYFLEALILNPENLFISLDVINEEGSARLTEPMEHTYMARVMLDHDILMKSDYLTTALFGFGNNNPLDKGITADWLDIFEASPYFSDYAQMGFGNLPYIQARAVIIGDTVQVYSESNRIYIQDAPLTLDYELEDLGIDKSGFNFTTSQLNNLEEMLDEYRSIIQHRMDTAAVRFINYINVTPRYSELRSVYRAIAMAKLYKSLDIEVDPYADIINTDIFPELLAHPDTFPRTYYDSLAYTKLFEEPFTDFGNQVQLREVWGGVEMKNINQIDSLGLDNEQRIIFNTTDTSFVEMGDRYFLNEGGVGVLLPELSPSDLLIRPTDTLDYTLTVNVPLTLSTRIYNTGNRAATNFWVKFFDTFKDANGIWQEYVVGEIKVDSIPAFANQEISIDWTPFQIGFHRYRVSVDSRENIVEVDEDNNDWRGYASIFNERPSVGFLNVANGFIAPDEGARFFYLATDAKEFIPFKVELISNKDGLLMDQNDSLVFSVPNLSLGEHLIKLRATNDRGFQDSVSVNIQVVEKNKPLVQLVEPFDNQVLFTQVPYALEALTFDFTDSTLCYDSTAVWLVGLDTVGVGCSASHSFDAVGTYDIIFSATNSLGNETRDTARVTVLDGSSNINTLEEFPSMDTSFVMSCLETLGCDTTLEISLPYNARVIDGLLSVEGKYILLEPENKSGGGDFGTSSVNTSYSSPTLNTNRSSYIYNRTTSSLGIDFSGSPYPPINEKDVYKLGETPVIATYLHDKTVAVDIQWVVTYPDGLQSTFEYTTPAPPSGQFYPVFPVGINISSTLGNNRQGQYTIEVFTKENGTSTYNLDQTIYFTYDYLKSEEEFNPGTPFEASQTISTGVQTSAPYSPVQFGLDTLGNTENRVYSYMTLEDVADSLYVKWNWYDPAGELYKSEIVRVQPPPGSNAWYDWVKAWSYLDVDGTNAGAITGEWTVSAQIRYFYQSGGITISSFPTILRDTFVIEGNGNISYPTNPKIQVGEELVWERFGAYTDSLMLNIAGGINAYLDADQSSGGMVNIPIKFSSDAPGDLISDSLYLRYALLDVMPPDIDSNVVTVSNPVISGQQFTLQATVTDNEIVSEVNLFFDGKSYSLTSTGSNIFEQTNIVAGISGEYPITIEAFDPSGNRSEYRTNLIITNPINNQAPVVSVTPSGWTSSTSFQVNWNDLGTPVEDYFLRVGQGNFSNEGSATSKSVSYSIDGANEVQLYGEDQIGNRTPIGTAQILLDKVPPNKLFFNPIAGISNWQKSTSFLLKWQNPGDVGGGIIDYEVKVNDSNPISIGDTICYSFSAAESGIYEVKARAKDIVNQYAEWSDSLLIKVDLTPPVTTTISSTTHPDTTKWYNDNDPKFQLTSQDDHSGISGHRYLFTSNPNSVPNSTSFFLQEDTLGVSALPVLNEGQGLSEGIWYLHMLPTDNVGNFGEISRFPVKIDVTAPFFNIDYPNSFEIDELPFTVNLSAKDALSGLQVIRYRLNNGAWQSGNQLVLNSQGLYEIDYFARDKAGNTTITRSITINIVSPGTAQCDVTGTQNINQNPISSDIYRSEGSITSSGKITTNSFVKFIAGGTITLEPGFHVQSNGSFHAYLGDCIIEETSDQVITRDENLSKPNGNYFNTQLECIPNPAKSTAIIRYQISFDQNVTLQIYSSTGQLVSSLLDNQYQLSGRHELEIDAGMFPGGIYIIRLLGEKTQISESLIVIR